MFSTCFTFEDLRKSYKTFCFIYHPDKGGTKEKFQEMQRQYEERIHFLKRYGERKTNAKAKEPEMTEDEMKRFSHIISKVLFPGVEIELVGCWIWLSGNTFPYRDKIKDSGFFWSSKHKKWFWNPEGKKRKVRSKKNYDELKNIYGVKRFTYKRSALNG